jgi:hypothetical protein
VVIYANLDLGFDLDRPCIGIFSGAELKFHITMMFHFKYHCIPFLVFKNIIIDFDLKTLDFQGLTHNNISVENNEICSTQMFS